MNIANRLTVVRVLLTPLFLLLFLWEFPFHYIAAAAVFGLAAYTDYLDGYLARKHQLVTNLGKFMDPIADKMLTTTAFVGFLAVGEMNAWALILILAREFVVTSVRLMAAENGTVVAANMWGKTKTVAQYIAILYLLCALEVTAGQETWLAAAALPAVFYTVIGIVGQVFLWTAVALTAVSGGVYFWQNRHFFTDM